MKVRSRRRLIFASVATAAFAFLVYLAFEGLAYMDQIRDYYPQAIAAGKVVQQQK